MRTVIIGIAADTHAVCRQLAWRNDFDIAIGCVATGISLADIVGQVAGMCSQNADAAGAEMVPPEQVAIRLRFAIGGDGLAVPIAVATDCSFGGADRCEPIRAALRSFRGAR